MADKRLLYWNEESTNLFPSGTVARAGDLRFIIKKSKTERPMWRVYLEVITHKEFGVKDSSKRGVLVAEFPGTLTLDQMHEEVEAFLLIFMGRIIADIQQELEAE